ncbi:hypothetical protein PR048_023630 [Dryococelus australis]|uniref:HAT C-terminal dimerisation domain-containing protein n=1 Tax=Dryococelus australis TaxID=614101 RepID=A0ABQ9GUN0_9NEOP|nr:hypothetical protein PR048_023630 [Dryococelus australis]
MYISITPPWQCQLESEEALCIFCDSKFSEDSRGEVWILCFTYKMRAHTECAGPESDIYVCGYCKPQQLPSSYDNASNMSGKYSGLQERIKELNEFAEYIPCFAHSLNLIGKCAAECCQEASLTPEEVSRESSNLVKSYPVDLEEILGEELLHFTELLKTELLISLITENSLECCFPNVETALRMYLSLMVTNCTGERSFSKLKRIKNELKTTMIVFTSCTYGGSTVDRMTFLLPLPGAAVAERLACCLPPRRTGLDPGRVTPNFRMWELCRTMPLVSGSSWGSPVLDEHF